MENERPVVPTGCFFQGCYNPEYEAEIRKGKDLCWRFNALHPCDREGQMAVLKELLGEMGRDVVFTPSGATTATTSRWGTAFMPITTSSSRTGRKCGSVSIKDKFRP